MLEAKKRHPGIQTVEWFTFQKDFRDDIIPELIPLEEFNTHENINTEIFNWVYFNPKSGDRRPRGILITRLKVHNENVYIIEIERRPIKKKGKEDEQSFKGYIFKLNSDASFKPWLRVLLLEIRSVKGILMRLESKCPGFAQAFAHKISKKWNKPGETALYNALNKMGINFKDRW